MKLISVIKLPRNKYENKTPDNPRRNSTIPADAYGNKSPCIFFTSRVSCMCPKSHLNAREPPNIQVTILPTLPNPQTQTPYLETSPIFYSKLSSSHPSSRILPTTSPISVLSVLPPSFRRSLGHRLFSPRSLCPTFSLLGFPVVVLAFL